MSSNVVERGYDQIAAAYRTNKNAGVLKSYYFKSFMDQLNKIQGCKRVCDLGCASGYPVAGYFAKETNVQYFGFDISEAQIKLANEEYGKSAALAFKQQDMMEAVKQWKNEENSAVLSLYAINHVPRVHHAFLLHHIYRSLAPGGILLFNMGGAGVDEGTSEDWLGTKMFWSQWSTEWYRVTMADLGFTMLMEFTDTNVFLGEEETHVVFLLQKKMIDDPY